jgi:hypothetical protein
VVRLDVSRDESVLKVKSLIKGEYHADPANVKGVFLFGMYRCRIRATSCRTAMHRITKAPGLATDFT